MDRTEISPLFRIRNAPTLLPTSFDFTAGMIVHGLFGSQARAIQEASESLTQF
jgi:hypothetical protein